MKSSIRSSSAASNSSISRKLAMWCSGITSRCVWACGLMSRIATRPSVAATWSPSRYSVQKRHSGSGGTDALLGDGGAPDADVRADRRVDEPRRVVVAVAAAGAVDEHDVVTAELRTPALEAGFVRGGAPACAAVLLLRLRDRIAALRLRARPRRIREDMDLRQSSGAHGAQRVRERALVLVGEADDDITREVELVGERREAAEVRRRRIPAAHCTEHVVIARLQRHVQVARDCRRLAQRVDQVVVDMVDLDRGQAQAHETRSLAHLAHEARQVEALLAVAIAAEIDTGEHDLAVPLRDAALDLSEHVCGVPAAGL